MKMKLVSALFFTPLFFAKSGDGDSVCEQCAPAKGCFEATACSSFDARTKKWTGAYDGCNAAWVCQDCFPELKDFPDTCSNPPPPTPAPTRAAPTPNPSANTNKDPNVVCDACEDSTPEGKGVSQGCFDAIKNYDPDTEPPYKSVCTATEASEVSSTCKSVAFAYFTAKCGDGDSVCEQCAPAKGCFEATACSSFDARTKRWTGAYDGCNAAWVCQDCFPELKDFPDSCKDKDDSFCSQCSASKPCFESSACAYFDLTANEWKAPYDGCNLARSCQDCFPELKDFPDTCSNPPPPTPAPTLAAPTPDPSCRDSSLKFKKGRKSKKYLKCSWIAKKKKKKCRSKTNASHCPSLCEQCKEFKCENSMKIIKVWSDENDEMLTGKCSKLVKDDPDLCDNVKFAQTCRKTCGYCDEAMP